MSPERLFSIEFKIPPLCLVSSNDRHGPLQHHDHYEKQGREWVNGELRTAGGRGGGRGISNARC